MMATLSCFEYDGTVLNPELIAGLAIRQGYEVLLLDVYLLYGNQLTLRASTESERDALRDFYKAFKGTLASKSELTQPL